MYSVSMYEKSGNYIAIIQSDIQCTIAKISLYAQPTVSIKWIEIGNKFILKSPTVACINYILLFICSLNNGTVTSKKNSKGF